MYADRIEILKNFNVDRASMDELFLAQNDVVDLRAAYERNGQPVPEWLDDKNRGIAADITLRTRDDLERRAKEISQQLAGLEPVADKRARLQKEKDELEAKLRGGVQVSQPA